MAKTNVSRRKHTNSKLGCSNCKRKKIRCDEKLPQCGNCSRGKREVCSYLSLTSSELNRIRLTHSLRNSQNKLLNQDYRLPTSSSHPQNAILMESIEFKYELTKLPLKIKNKTYTSIHFDNSSINDFIDYDRPANLSLINSITKKSLPNAIAQPITVAKLDHNLPRVDPIQFSKPVVPNLTHQFIPGKFNLFDHFKDYLIASSKNLTNFDVTFDALYLVGLSTIENALKKKQIYSKTKQVGFTHQDSKQISNSVLSRLKVAIEKCKTQWMHRSLKFINFDTQALGYSCFLFHFDIDLDIEQYYQMSILSAKLFKRYVDATNSKKADFPILINYVIKNLHYNFASIRIPSYDPTFYNEVVSNLQDLHFVYNFNPLILCEDPDFQLKYDQIRYKFNCLMNFLQDSLLPIVFSERNESYISVYPQTSIYSIVKLWHKIFPSTAMTYNPKDDANKTYESRFIQDLNTTLYMYYFAISVALEATFPICKYLFTVSFMTPTTAFFKNQSIMTPLKYNLIYNKFNHPGLPEKLQKHIYYSMRLYSFFQRRYLIYQNAIIWINAYNDNMKENRWGSRTIKNSIEVPVTHFNTTLIRPEHYPTASTTGTQNDSFLTRTDENIANKLYKRNIERLDFFNESSLQFDYETMLLLRDYRKLEHIEMPQENSLGVSDLMDYYEDRNLILSAVFEKTN